mgnify:CR=1 FL=1
MELEKILKRLLGEIEPTGDSSRDKERYLNIRYYEEALYYIYRRLNGASKYKDDYRESMSEIGKSCQAIIEGIKDTINYNERLKIQIKENEEEN